MLANSSDFLSLSLSFHFKLVKRTETSTSLSAKMEINKQNCNPVHKDPINYNPMKFFNLLTCNWWSSWNNFNSWKIKSMNFIVNNTYCQGSILLHTLIKVVKRMTNFSLNFSDSTHCWFIISHSAGINFIPIVAQIVVYIFPKANPAPILPLPCLSRGVSEGARV